MRRQTAIELAAVASAAVPGLNVTAFGPEPDDTADFSSALLVDSEGRRWRVRSPKHSEASTRLETERQVLRAFSPGIRAELPFLLPTVAGTVLQNELITFVYSHIAGQTETVEELAAAGPKLALEIGAAIAAIHDLPQELVTSANLPSYTANEFRQRKLNELDQAATTGKIPASLLRRWEQALEDVPLWRFNSCVVHGDLHEDNILLENNRVTAVMGWTDLRIGDPADDFAWLVAINDQNFVETLMQAYAAARNESPDPHLLRRAALSAEFALAQWLVKGFATDSARMVADAESMLATLKADIDAYGGQELGTEDEAPHAARAQQSTTQPASQPAPQRSEAPPTPPHQAPVGKPAVELIAVADHEPDDEPGETDSTDKQTDDVTGHESDGAIDGGAEGDQPDKATTGKRTASQEDVDTTALTIVPSRVDDSDK